MNDNDLKFGYIIGRFNFMHLGHHELVDEMIKKSDHHVIFIGSADKLRTDSNPLSFEERKSLMEAHYPNSTIIGIDDMDDMDLWKEVLDGHIEVEVAKIVQKTDSEQNVNINIFSPTRDDDHVLRASWINDDHTLLTFTPTHDISATSLRKLWRENKNFSHLVKKETALFLDTLQFKK